MAKNNALEETGEKETTGEAAASNNNSRSNALEAVILGLHQQNARIKATQESITSFQQQLFPGMDISKFLASRKREEQGEAAASNNNSRSNALEAVISGVHQQNARIKATQESITSFQQQLFPGMDISKFLASRTREGQGR